MLSRKPSRRRDAPLHDPQPALAVSWQCNAVHLVQLSQYHKHCNSIALRRAQLPKTTLSGTCPRRSLSPAWTAFPLYGGPDISQICPKPDLFLEAPALSTLLVQLHVDEMQTLFEALHVLQQRQALRLPSRSVKGHFSSSRAMEHCTAITATVDFATEHSRASLTQPFCFSRYSRNRFSQKSDTLVTSSNMDSRANIM